MHAEGLVDLVDVRQTSENGAKREIYTISVGGHIRLQEETARLNHAVEIAKYKGVLDNRTPTDIQRLLAEVE